jgi:hypothetical protein
MTTLRASLATVQHRPTPRPRIVERNTFAFTRPDGAEVVRLHMTDIVTRTPDGRTRLDSGGWRTMTTKDRMNTHAAPYVVHSRAGVWYVSERGAQWSPEGRSVPFYDGIVLPDAFDPQSKAARCAAKALTEQTQMKAQLGHYLKRLRALPELPLPHSGDCWLCLMRSADGESWGDSVGAADRHDHLRSHLAEGYIHGSLILNALREKGWTDTGIRLAFASRPQDSLRQRVARAVADHFKRRLGMA